MKHLTLAVTVAGLLVATQAPRADAQQPITVGAGFQALHDSDAGRTFPGWVVHATVPTVNRYGVSAEASGGSTRFGTPSGDTRLRIQAVMAGVRVSGPTTARRAHPFGELLIGAAHASVRAGSRSAGTTKPALQPVGGIELPLTSRIGVRGAVFYRRIFSSPGANEAGAQVGIVVALPR